MSSIAVFDTFIPSSISSYERQQAILTNPEFQRHPRNHWNTLFLQQIHAEIEAEMPSFSMLGNT